MRSRIIGLLERTKAGAPPGAQQQFFCRSAGERRPLTLPGARRSSFRCGPAGGQTGTAGTPPPCRGRRTPGGLMWSPPQLVPRAPTSIPAELGRGRGEACRQAAGWWPRGCAGCCRMEQLLCPWPQVLPSLNTAVHAALTSWAAALAAAGIPCSSSPRCRRIQHPPGWAERELALSRARACSPGRAHGSSRRSAAAARHCPSKARIATGTCRAAPPWHVAFAPHPTCAAPSLPGPSLSAWRGPGREGGMIGMGRMASRGPGRQGGMIGMGWMAPGTCTDCRQPANQLAPPAGPGSGRGGGRGTALLPAPCRPGSKQRGRPGLLGTGAALRLRPTSSLLPQRHCRGRAPWPAHSCGWVGGRARGQLQVRARAGSRVPTAQMQQASIRTALVARLGRT